MSDERKVLLKQKIQVNVLDAATKQLIRENFLIDEGYVYGIGQTYFLMENGVLFAERTNIFQSYETAFNFVESQVTAFGYNYNSITGNVIEPILDSATELYMYPSVVNIYMSKL